jgi:cell wall-associated NlpC family hydrolase
VVFLFVSCSVKEQKVELLPKKQLNVKTVQVCSDIKDNKIYDLQSIPQDIDLFTKKLNTALPLHGAQKKYEEDYFRVWNFKTPSKSIEDVQWPFESYSSRDGYGENLQPLKDSFFEEMYDNANFENYLNVSKRAITLKHLNIRAFPTLRPLFKNPSLAGEGFPFDYLQDSTIFANKPVFVSHFSQDKEWVFIFSSFTFGWVKSADIVFMDKKYTDRWQKAQQIFITKENTPIYNTENSFLFRSKIGMMLPIIKELEDSYIVLAISKYKNSKPFYEKAKISKEISHKGVMKFSDKNLARIISEVFVSNYGWGGMYGQRDCSSTMRDIFAPFGIWLPRNSYQQAKVGKVISLKGLSDEEKISLIKDEAIAFETLLYRKGHIMLYVGTYNNEIIVLHNMWGIKTKKDGVYGRVIVGKTVLSTLEIGKYQEDFDKNSSLLRNIISLNIFTH